MKAPLADTEEPEQPTVFEAEKSWRKSRYTKNSESNEETLPPCASQIVMKSREWGMNAKSLLSVAKERRCSVSHSGGAKKLCVRLYWMSEKRTEFVWLETRSHLVDGSVSLNGLEAPFTKQLDEDTLCESGVNV